MQAALAAAGPQVHTQSWLLSFTENLLAEVDRREAQGISVRELGDMLSAWRWHMSEALDAEQPQWSPDVCHRQHGTDHPEGWMRRMNKHADIPRKLLTQKVNGMTLTWSACCRLLEVTEAELEIAMWPYRMAELKANAELVMNGDKTIAEICGAAGGGRAARLRAFLRLRHGWVGPGRNGAPKKFSDEAVALALDLIDVHGFSYSKAFAALVRKGDVPADLNADTFSKRIRRARKQVA